MLLMNLIIIKTNNNNNNKLYFGAVVSTVPSLQEGPGFNSPRGPFCVGFTCPPRVRVRSL